MEQSETTRPNRDCLADEINGVRNLGSNGHQPYPIPRRFLQLAEFVPVCGTNVGFRMGAPRTIFRREIWSFEMAARHNMVDMGMLFTCRTNRREAG